MVVDFGYNYTRIQKCLQIKNFYTDLNSFSSSYPVNISSRSSTENISDENISDYDIHNVISNTSLRDTSTRSSLFKSPSIKCVFDKSYYKMTLTEEVSVQALFKSISF